MGVQLCPPAHVFLHMAQLCKGLAYDLTEWAIVGRALGEAVEQSAQS